MEGKMKIHPCHQKEEGACFAGNNDPSCSECWIDVPSIDFVADEYKSEYTSQQAKEEGDKELSSKKIVKSFRQDIRSLPKLNKS